MSSLDDSVICVLAVDQNGNNILKPQGLPQRKVSKKRAQKLRKHGKEFRLGLKNGNVDTGRVIT